MTARETNIANAFETQLTVAMGPTDLTASVATTTGGPPTPSYLVIEPDSNTQREVIYFDGVYTGTTFVTSAIGNRYLSGSAAGSGITHPVGSRVRCVPLKQHIEDLNDRVDGSIAATLLDANSVLIAIADDTPVALAMGASTILARLAAGNIVAATPAQLRTLLSLVPGTDVQAYDADLATYAGITPSANVQSLLGAANYAAMRTLLSLVIGTNVQAWDADLDAIAALVSAANKMPYATGAGTWALADLSAAGRALIDDADASAQLTTLGVSTFIKTLLDDADAATARTTLGVSGSSSLTSDSGSLGANVTLPLNTTTDVIATGSLAVGTWLVTMSAGFTTAATGAGNQIEAQAVVGTATATFSGPRAGTVSIPVAGERDQVSFTFVATVTVAGTLKLQANSFGAAATAEKFGGVIGVGPVTGYTATKIA